MILGVSGHRKVQNKLLTYRKILKYLSQIKPEHVIVGGAKGFDSLVMRACYILRIRYTVYLPFKRSVKGDYTVGNISYKTLLDNAFEVFCEANNYTGKHLYQQRNKRIVDISDKLLIYWNGKPSGTANTVRYAKQRNYSVNDFKNIY